MTKAFSLASWNVEHFKFKRVLDEQAGGAGKANYIFLGDFNTMGMKYPYNQTVEVKRELKKLDRDAEKAGMRRLAKTSEATWWNGPGSRFPKADLDHVVAAEHLRFTPFADARVEVRGWPALATEQEQADWSRDFSVHGLLFCEVRKS